MIRWFAVATIACILLAVASFGMATREGGVQATYGLDGDGPWQRFIIKYRPDSAPGQDPEKARARLESPDYPASADGDVDRSVPRLQWQRRLGVGADLFMTGQPLDRSDAQRLLEALAQDPEVQYVEAETMMHALPARPQRPF
ncbi:hypothetical protein ACW7G2_05040 [Luteimonas sp. A277]